MRGCDDDSFPWKENDGGTTEWLHTKAPYVCPAVTNAVLNKCSHDVAGCRIYVMIFPNSDCAKVIIQSRIEEVVILQPKDTTENEEDDDIETQAGRILLTMAGVKIRYCKPSFSSVTLDFVSILSPTVDSTSSQGLLPEISPEAEQEERESKEMASQLLLKEANYDVSSVGDNDKRKEYISWLDYFMSMALLTAQRSKDPNTQVGACIVDAENRIIGLGYNGFPSGVSSTSGQKTSL